MFEKLDYTEEGNIITLKTAGEFYQYNWDDPNRPAISNAMLVINSKYKIIDSNADEVKSNQHIWIINKDTTNKIIMVSIDKTKTTDAINITQTFKLRYIYIPYIILVMALIIVGIKVWKLNIENNTI
jgi:hypothetical protein